jgi:uncharacterized protein DUF4396
LNHDQHETTDSSRLAVRATLHCLTGCVIGELAGMTIGTAAGLSNAITVALAIVLAFVFGYGLTMRPLLAAGTPFGAAARTALAGDTVSIVIMEAIDNVFVLAVPGAMDAGLVDPLFWASLAAGFAIAFPFAFLANRALLIRGVGQGAHGAHH